MRIGQDAATRPSAEPPDQMTSFTTNKSMSALTPSWPSSSAWMVL